MTTTNTRTEQSRTDQSTRPEQSTRPAELTPDPHAVEARAAAHEPTLHPLRPVRRRAVRRAHGEAARRAAAPTSTVSRPFSGRPLVAPTSIPDHSGDLLGLPDVSGLRRGVARAWAWLRGTVRSAADVDARLRARRDEDAALMARSGGSAARLF